MIIGFGSTEVDNIILYNNCVEQKSEDGFFEISCKLGMWCVFGADYEKVLKEAIHYWLLYYLDGEYNDLLMELGLLTGDQK